MLKQRSLCRPDRDLCVECRQFPCSLTLLAMMMREQHPLDPSHANLTECVQHRAIAEINQHRRIAVAYNEDIASVRPHENVGSDLCERGHGAVNLWTARHSGERTFRKISQRVVLMQPAVFAAMVRSFADLSASLFVHQKPA